MLQEVPTDPLHHRGAQPAVPHPEGVCSQAMTSAPGSPCELVSHWPGVIPGPTWLGMSDHIWVTKSNMYGYSTSGALKSRIKASRSCEESFLPPLLRTLGDTGCVCIISDLVSM